MTERWTRESQETVPAVVIDVTDAWTIILTRKLLQIQFKMLEYAQSHRQMHRQTHRHTYTCIHTRTHTYTYTQTHIHPRTGRHIGKFGKAKQGWQVSRQLLTVILSIDQTGTFLLCVITCVLKAKCFISDTLLKVGYYSMTSCHKLLNSGNPLSVSSR